MGLFSISSELSFVSHVCACFRWTALVAEIKEIKEKQQKEDDVLLSIAAGSRHTIIPNLEFEYTDTEVHEDVFRIIKYSCEEVCSTKDQLNKVLWFWTTFLEPLLNINSRLHGSEIADDHGASKHETVKSITTSMVESEGSPNGNAINIELKQPKLNCNVNPSRSPERIHFSRTDFTNVDALAKGVVGTSGEKMTNSDAVGTSGPDANHGKHVG